MKEIRICYYALLREERGLSEETVATSALNASELYKELKIKHNFKLSTDLLRIAINNEFSHWEKELRNGDQVIFIPPVAGG